MKHIQKSEILKYVTRTLISTRSNFCQGHKNHFTRCIETNVYLECWGDFLAFSCNCKSSLWRNVRNSIFLPFGILPSLEMLYPCHMPPYIYILYSPIINWKNEFWQVQYVMHFTKITEMLKFNYIFYPWKNFHALKGILIILLFWSGILWVLVGFYIRLFSARWLTWLSRQSVFILPFYLIDSWALYMLLDCLLSCHLSCFWVDSRTKWV